MKLRAIILTALVAITGLFTLSAQASPKTVDYVDPARYLGDWYQIANKPQWFEPKGCSCARQRLTDGQNGVLTVYNSCNENNPAGKLKEIRGYATNTDTKSNAKWSIDFGLPWKGTYWIIALDPEYRWAVVTDEDERTAYILSKTPELSDDLYKEAFGQAATQLDMTDVKKTYQTNCSYPKLAPFAVDSSGL